MDEITLTAVGKIFKPALTRAQVKDVYEAELRKIEGVKNLEVVADGDKRLGTIATVPVTPAKGVGVDTLKAEIEKVLGRYTVFANIVTLTN